MTFVPLQERGLGISEIIWRATGKSGTSKELLRAIKAF